MAVIQLDVASKTDTGQVRENNEDAYGFFEPKNPTELTEKGLLYIVADGMGGHKGGEVASRLAVETISTQYYSSEEKDPSKALTDAFIEANLRIYEKATSDESLFGMGTTCTAMVIWEEKAFFAHVGDSRAYICRDGELRQITEDHSVVGEMIRIGMITKEIARIHPQRNVITRSLGIQEFVRADTPETPFDINEGDIFLLCSDGLTALVGNGEIKSVLESNTADKACSILIRLANERGGIDNITVQIVKVLGL